MARPGLPSITKMEEVLDLITNPEKYKKYIVEFMTLHAELKNMLGDLATKELAESFLSQAAEAKSFAEQDRKKTSVFLADAKEQAEALHLEAEQHEAASKQILEEVKVKLEHEKKELAKQKALHAQHAQDVTKAQDERQRALDTKAESLSKLGEILSKKQAKFELALQ